MSIVQVGNRTLVSKITYGTPYRSAVISASADIDAITGLVTTGAVNGSLFIYDSDTSSWNASLSLNKQIIDGRTYPSDSDRSQILIRRSGTQGDPLVLRTGELAYSYFSDSGSPADGFGAGGDRLFIGAGGDSSVGGVLTSERIDVIGGKYFTDLLNHPHGTLTASSAIIVDSNSNVNQFRTNALFADSSNLTYLYVGDSALINNLQVLSILAVNDLTVAGDTILNNTTINQTLNVVGRATFDSSVDILNNLTVSGVSSLDSVVMSGPVTFSGDVFIGAQTLSEFIDSDVFQLLRAGQAISLVYSDDSDKLTVSVPLATTSAPGVASYDSDQFSIDSSGSVTATQLLGGTF